MIVALLGEYPRGVDNGNGTFWFHFALRAIVPVLGILLEFFGSRFAKWVNVGYFTFVAVVIFGMNFFVGSHFFIHRHFNRSWGFPLAAAGVTYFLYSSWWVAPQSPDMLKRIAPTLPDT